MENLAGESTRARPPYVPLKRASFLTSLPDTVQLNRRASLRAVIDELHWMGTLSAEEQVASLGFSSREVLTSMLQGAEIPAVIAREIEWAMQKRDGWMDDDRRSEVLDR